MEIDITEASEPDKEIIQNLSCFYVYDMSRYCGFLPGWKTPRDGHFTCFDLSSYWEEEDRYPFLIHIDNELAGFALIHKEGSVKAVDWVMGEFFIVAKFQGKGIGRQIACEIFTQLPGTWEVMQIPENKAAITFWEKVIHEYTQGHFVKTTKTVSKPKPHPMVVMTFYSKSFE